MTTANSATSINHLDRQVTMHKVGSKRKLVQITNDSIAIYLPAESRLTDYEKFKWQRVK